MDVHPKNVDVVGVGVRARRAAAAIVVAYIAIQAFQDVVYRVLGEPSDAAGELALAPAPLNLARAALLLLSFFGMAFVFLVICAEHRARRPLAAVAAFLGLLMFCTLEIGLRSVELFYCYARLPVEYATAPAAALDKMATFQAVQGALYFPLMLSHVIGCAILALTLSPTPRRNWLLIFAFGLNAVRLALRITGSVLHTDAFDFLLGNLYFPLVVIIETPIAIWLWRS